VTWQMTSDIVRVIWSMYSGNIVESSEFRRNRKSVQNTHTVVMIRTHLMGVNASHEVIVNKAIEERHINPKVKDGHSLVMDKWSKAVRFGTIKEYG
jgi:hypothetical protein